MPGPPSPIVKHDALYRWIFSETMDRGYQPCIKEMMAVFKIPSTNTAKKYLDALEHRGWLRQRGNARSIEFILCPDGTPFKGFRLKD